MISERVLLNWSYRPTPVKTNSVVTSPQTSRRWFMNWEAIGAIGELTGAAGVILTLVYLSLQIQQNSEEGGG